MESGLETSEGMEMAKLRDNVATGDVKGKKEIEEERNGFLEVNLLNVLEDNPRLLERIKERYDRVGLNFPTVEVRFENVRVEADCEVVRGKALPTLFNAFRSSAHDILAVQKMLQIIKITCCEKSAQSARLSGLYHLLSIDFNSLAHVMMGQPEFLAPYETAKGVLRMFGYKVKEERIAILRDVSGIIKPSRMTLLLGPPGCGKTTLLRALSGRLDKSLKVEGEISYNGFRLDEFVPERTSAYVSQYDMHVPEMTVRETLDFSARCQGVGIRAEMMMELETQEKEAGIVPDTDLDTFMKAISSGGQKKSLQTDYVLKILGLDVCSDVIVGDAMRRGISGGEKRRVTLGEMIVGSSRTFFMDEISNGLDSSTTFQIVSSLQQSVNIMETTILVSLLQPAPEVFNLFDDIILMAKGRIIYHGPRDCVFEFFESCGFRCPERKSPADFLHEVISMKDQGQYWCCSDQPYHYVPLEQFTEKFKAFSAGQKLSAELSQPCCIHKSCKNALSFTTYSLSKMEMFKACSSREWLLAKRDFVIYVSKLVQLMFLAFIAMTVFIRTQMSVDLVHANYYMGSLFFSLLLIMINNSPELIMTLSRLGVFYKQRDSYFYPAWAFSLPSSVLKIPYSFVASFLFTSLSYYVIGYSPEVSRFFSQFLVFFALHLTSGMVQRTLASVCRTFMSATVAGSFATFAILTFGGFILPLPSIPVWMTWGFWISPLSYAEIGVTINEFLAPRWKQIYHANVSVSEQVLRRRGLLYDGYFYWISVGALFGFFAILNIIFTLALTYLRPPGKSKAMISFEKLSQLQGKEDNDNESQQEMHSATYFLPISSTGQKGGKMALRFVPLALSFKDIQYFVDAPAKMRSKGETQQKIQLLRDITGAFRPHVLTALMGVSGSGKTTLLDVLSGRKTVGTIQGDIRVGGYPKVQETFCRVSGYCEQNDIHSPHITVEESIIHSASLRLGPEISQEIKKAFVNEVLETIELDEIKDTLVGIPGISGLSIEQRKRLTFGVELVANPSIMFIDEPTSGLDARTAAIVMRVVKNVVQTGRTVVCTIHQPSIDIFESFDELILIKKGGQVIYSGQIGRQSESVISYFEGIPGIPKIKDNYNPATWMLEVTSTSVERQHGIDFAQIYKDSSLYQDTKMLVEQLSIPPPGSTDLHFSTRFSMNKWVQFTACLKKLHLSYWRSPQYNLKRISFTFVSSLFLGLLFWKHGSNINTEQDLFNIAGFMFSAVTFLGINNCQSVQDFVMKERLVLYRERFVGMYSSHIYALAQIAIEIPYVFVQAAIHAIIAYFLIGFQFSHHKFMWYFGTMFLTILYYTYLGMLIISGSPSMQIAMVHSSTIFTVSNIFTGFLIPRPQIPTWWVWCYWISPSGWALNALLTSQYSDMDKEIDVFGENIQGNSFLKDFFGFHHDELGHIAIILVGLPLLVASLFVVCIAKLNFQKR